MSAFDRLVALDAPSRLAARDASLFADDTDTQAEVAANLGWTHLAEDAAAELARITALAAEMRAEGLTDVVLLGMGGSSLASLVVGRVVGETAAGAPRLHVLDTTSPITVAATLDSLDFATSAVLVSSKSGTTIEPLSLYAVFRDAADRALGRDAAGEAVHRRHRPRLLPREARCRGGLPRDGLLAGHGGRALLGAHRLRPGPGARCSASISSACWRPPARWRRRATALRPATPASNSRPSRSTRTPPGATSSR